MAILFELSEEIIKQAALISSKYPDRSLLSVIEECFDYGARSLYSDAPKPVPPQRKPFHEYFKEPVKDEVLEDINSTVSSISKQAQEEVDNMICYSDDELPESLSNPLITSDGDFVL